MRMLFVRARVVALSLAVAVIVIVSGSSAERAVAASADAAASYPTWAYLWEPAFATPPADDTPRRLPGSESAVSWAQARDLFFAPNWHPEDHPAMPEVVARGRKPDVRACGSCHRPEGTGGPESASLAGLPVEYLVQQMADIKNGSRKSSGPQRTSITLMTAVAKSITDGEVRAAAEYFSALKPKRMVTLVESDTVPQTYVARLFYAKKPDGGTEALGRRIVEMPEDVEQFELRDARAKITAYVPPGSIAKGAALAKTGGAGTTVACATCHGADLKGLGAVPGIAGRSPTYMVRQLFDFKVGTRAGPGSALMKPVVEHLSEDDMIALAAYVSSLAPQ